ncbi:MAG: PAS domain S-box protein [Caldisericia bacterium]|nr:PAS domain S-box protein [Caldisericia bacterium]
MKKMDTIYYDILNSAREITFELLKSHTIREKIEYALKKLGEAGGFNKVSFYEKDIKNFFIKKYEWVSNEIYKDNDVKLELDENKIEILLKDEAINLKKEAFFPILVNNDLKGVIRFLILNEERQISPFDIYALKSGVEVIEASLEREELIKSIEEQRELLNKVVNNIKELITVQDNDLNILFANKAAGDSVNKKPDELIGEKCFKIWHQRNTPCENCPVKIAFITKKFEEGEITTPDGRIWHIKGIPVLNENGEVQYVVESTIEITKEREYLRKIQESEERFRKIFDSTNVGIAILDKDGKYLYMNQKRAEILGYTVEEMLEKTFKDIIHPDDFMRVNEIYNKLVSGEIKNFELDIKFIRKDGEIVYNRDYVVGVEDENGKFLYAIAVVVDITKEIKFSFDLKEKEELIKAIFDQFSVGVNITDSEGKVLLSNKALQKMLGYSLDELKTFTFKDYSHPGELEKNIELFEKIKKGEINNYILEKRFIRKDGSIFWGKITTNAIKDEKGNIKYFITLVEDIDERVKYFENLKIEENRLRAIIDVMPDLIFILDKDGNFLNYHGDLNKLLLEPEEFLGKNIIEVMGKDIGEKTKESIKKTLKENVLTSFVYDLPCPHNKEEKCFYEARFVKFEEDKSLVLIRDITESVRNLNLLKKKEEELHKSFYQTINLLAKIVEMKEPYTAGHQRRTAEIGVLIAKELKLSDYTIETIRVAGLVHDIGKIEIPMEILNKPVKLSPIDWDFVKKHPEIGYEILKEIDFPWNIKDVVLEHHEKYDGSGYPYGLKNDEILIEARIICVADSIEAMSTHRPYRPRLSREKIIDELKKYRGSWYDPQIVDIALKLIEEGKIKI